MFFVTAERLQNLGQMAARRELV